MPESVGCIRHRYMAKTAKNLSLPAPRRSWLMVAKAQPTQRPEWEEALPHRRAPPAEESPITLAQGQLANGEVSVVLVATAVTRAGCGSADLLARHHRVAQSM